MAVRPDFAPGQDYDLGFLTQLLRSPETFDGTGLAEPMAHIGNAIAGTGGKPLTPEQMARTTAEAKRLMNGGVPREQLDELKKMLKGKVGEFFEAARNSEVYNLPPHLLDAKEYMAGQVRMMDNKTAAFSGANIGKTPEEMQREREQNASSMLSLFLDSLTAEMSNEDTGEVIDSVKQTLDEGSVGGIEGAEQIVDQANVPGPGQNRTFMGQGPGTVGQPTPAIQQTPGGASGFEGRRDPFSGDVEMHKIQGPLAGMLPRTQDGLDASGGSMDSAGDDELLNSMSAPEIRDYLAEAEKLLSETPERQIAKLQEPNAAMWIGVAIAGILFPNMRPALFALPFQVALGEMDRQQKLYDQAYLDANDRQKKQLSLLFARGDQQQQEMNRAQALAIHEDKEARADKRALLELTFKGTEADRKVLLDLYDKMDEMIDKGGTPEQMTAIIGQINSLSPGAITPEEAQARTGAASNRFNLKTRGQTALAAGREASAETAEWRLDRDKRWDSVLLSLKNAQLEGQLTENELKKFELLNAPQDLAIKWANDWARYKQTLANIDNMIADNNRQGAQLELGKLNAIRSAAEQQIGILKERKATTQKELDNLSRQKEAAILSGASTTDIDAQIAALSQNLTEWDMALGKEGGLGVRGIPEGATGMYGYLEQITNKIGNISDSFGGIQRPGSPEFPDTKVKVPAGFKDSNTVKGPLDSGKLKFDNGGTFDLDALYDLGSKGEGGKTDCSGAVCSYIKSTGSPAAEKFPSGSIKQIEFIEANLTAGTGDWSDEYESFWKKVDDFAKELETYNAWAKRFNAATAGEQVVLAQQEPRKPTAPSLNKSLRNGDLVYFNVPKTKPEDSGRHVGVFVGLDKDGQALIAEAYSSKVGDKEQVRVRPYNLDDLLPKTEEELKSGSSKFVIGAYRFYPKGKG